MPTNEDIAREVLCSRCAAGSPEGHDDCNAVTFSVSRDRITAALAAAEARGASAVGSLREALEKIAEQPCVHLETVNLHCDDFLGHPPTCNPCDARAALAHPEGPTESGTIALPLDGVDRDFRVESVAPVGESPRDAIREAVEAEREACAEAADAQAEAALDRLKTGSPASGMGGMLRTMVDQARALAAAIRARQQGED